MRRVFKISLWGIIVVLAVGAGLFAAAHLLTLDMCENQVVAEMKSPDGRHKAVEFERDCGATTDFGTQVSVIKSNKQLGSDSTGNTFRADSGHGSVPVHGGWCDGTRHPVVEQQYAANRIPRRSTRLQSKQQSGRCINPICDALTNVCAN